LGHKSFSCLNSFLYIKSDWGAIFGSVGQPWSSLQTRVLPGLNTKPVINHHYLSAKQGVSQQPGEPHQGVSPGRGDSGQRRAWWLLKKEGDEGLGRRGEYSTLVEN